MSRPVRVADPGAHDRAHRQEIESAIARVLDRGHYVLGEEVAAFEREFAAYCGVAHGVGTANGTDALVLALEACGVRPGQPVFTVSHTAVATVAAIELAGALPILVDVDPRSFTMDPGALSESLARHLPGGSGPEPRGAIVPVHLYGQPADLSGLPELARSHGLALVEDCAQAHGAGCADRRVGSFGRAAAFSFYPTKNLGALGDGGMVVTDDLEVAARLRRLRQYGWGDDRSSREPGRNSRLDELQAAVLRGKLVRLDRDNERRRAIARRYTEALAGTRVRLPVERDGTRHVYHLYVIGSEDRDRLRGALLERGVETGIHYPLAVHEQPAYRGRLAGADRLPSTEHAARAVLSLPMHPALTDEDVGRVIEAVRACAGRAAGEEAR